MQNKVKNKLAEENETETEWMEQGRSVRPYNFYRSPSQESVFQQPVFNDEMVKPRRQMRKIVASVALIVVCLTCWIYLTNITHQVLNYWSLIMGVLTGIVFFTKKEATRFNATAGYLVFVGSGLGFAIVSLILLPVKLHLPFAELRQSLGLFTLVQASLEALKICDVFIFLASIALALLIANFTFLKHIIRPKH